MKSCCQPDGPRPSSTWGRLVSFGFYALVALALAFVAWQEMNG